MIARAFVIYGHPSCFSSSQIALEHPRRFQREPTPVFLLGENIVLFNCT